jgi:predicted outer membrane protein
MKLKSQIIIYIYAAVIVACNAKPKDSLAKADSANKANLDKGLVRNEIVIDEKSADFLVRIADVISSEKEVSYLAMHQGVNTRIKDFAATLYHELEGLNDSIQSLRIRKKIVLPSRVSAERQLGIDAIKKTGVASLDQAYVDYVIQSHEYAEKILEDGMNNAKDEEIKSFADITHILLKKYLNSAKSLK